MFVFVQQTVAAVVKDVDELHGVGNAQEVKDLVIAFFKHQLDVRFVQQALLSEVSLSDGMPDFFALASAPNHGLGLRDETLHLELGDVGQGGEGLGVSNSA